VAAESVLAFRGMEVEIRLIIAGIFLFLGCFLMLVAAIGVVRFPDFYTRMHAAGKGDTLGQLLVLLALMIHEGLSLVSIKLLLIVAFIFVCSPTATHALAKAAYLSGLRPWTKEEKKDGN